MPGIEKRLARYAQFYSRIGFAHHFRPLQAEEAQEILVQKSVVLGVSLKPEALSDPGAVTAIIRITGGNFRLMQRLLEQIERVLGINKLDIVTRDVVEKARELLVIGEA